AESDFVINGTIDEEACPNNLAPTTSTTVHLALGDALAVCLLSLREFSSADFAKYHPGGSLGKRLYLKVDDIILHNEKPTVKTDTNLRDVIMEISSKRLGVTVVLDGEENLVGIITDGDLRRMLESNDQWKDMKAEDIMSKSPKSLQLGEYAVTALKVMQDNSITQILIMDGKKFAGIVHLHDLLKEGIV
ncbi:MAG: CBS domain-containing protein, partial [Cyclobacteriaceae bacterium]|nr:CBS domain-containing protein [Cyclobacteriaceae bacterium]